jgi:hypothetical protein
MATYYPTSNVTVGGSLTATAANHNSVLSVSNGASGTTWSNSTNAKMTTKGQLHLEGDDADIVMNGASLKDMLNSITDRLAILQPKPELLAKYTNLREAYEHYKTLEALLHEAADGK